MAEYTGAAGGVQRRRLIAASRLPFL